MRRRVTRSLNGSKRTTESADSQATYEAVFRLVLYGLRQHRSTPEEIRQELLGATHKARGWFGSPAGEMIAAVIQRAIADALAYHERHGTEG